jgi:hypothetical protein
LKSQRFRFAWIAVVGLAACGGAGSAARPKPLQYHLKDHLLSRVPEADKAEMVAARAEHRRAREENRKALSERASSARALAAATREAEKAHQQKDAADKRRSDAEDSKDWDLKNRVTRDQRVAEVTVRAAEQKLRMLEAHRDWLAELVKYTLEKVYAAEAKYELAKANVARAHDIAPPDFAYQAYVDQYEQRRARAERLKGPADEEKEIWLAEKKEWEAKRRDENEARGIDTAATRSANSGGDE